MNKNKAKLVTIVISVFVLLLCVDMVTIWPKMLPWILGAFALPGFWKFCRVLYIWLTTDPEPTDKDYKWFAKTPEERKCTE